MKIIRVACQDSEKYEIWLNGHLIEVCRNKEVAEEKVKYYQSKDKYEESIGYKPVKTKYEIKPHKRK